MSGRRLDDERTGAAVDAEPAPGDVDSSSLAARALGGVAWNWGASAMLVVAQVASTAATARLVAPDEFGAYATAQAAAAFTGYLTMRGVGPDLQRRASLGTHTVGTAMSISLAGAAVILAALWVLAPAWAELWRIEDATATVRALAVAVFLTTLSVVPLALLARRLEFAKVALLEAGSLTVGLGVGVALAADMHSALALALGQVVAAALLATAAAIYAGRELDLSFDRHEARGLSKFAAQFGGIGFVSYFTNTAPSWFAARVYGASALGLYSRANLIVALPAEYGLRGILKVIYPIYGRVRESRERTRTALAEALTLTTGAAWPVFGLLAGSAPVVVVVLLGDRWADAAPLLAWSAAIVSAWIPCGLLTNAAEAMGWMRLIAFRQLILFALVAAALLTAYAADLDLSAALAGVAIAEAITYLVTLRLFVRRGMLEAASTAREHMVHLAVGVAAFAAAAGLAHALDGVTTAGRFAAQVLLGIVVMAIVAARPLRLPATEVLARRLEADPEQGLLSAAWKRFR